MPTPFDRVTERYQTDAPFRRLVDMMMHMALQLQFSPGELREAAVFAEYRAQMLKPLASMFFPNERGSDGK